MFLSWLCLFFPLSSFMNLFFQKTHCWRADDAFLSHLMAKLQASDGFSSNTWLSIDRARSGPSVPIGIWNDGMRLTLGSTSRSLLPRHPGAMSPSPLHARTTRFPIYRRRLQRLQRRSCNLPAVAPISYSSSTMYAGSYHSPSLIGSVRRLFDMFMSAIFWPFPVWLLTDKKVAALQ